MRHLPWVCVVVLASCQQVVDPGYELFTPPAEWSAWYAEVSECTGIEEPRPFGEIRFHWADLLTSRDTWTVTLNGQFIRPRTIVLSREVEADGPAYLRQTVKHELLHFFLLSTGDSDPEHTSPLWTTCAPWPQ